MRGSQSGSTWATQPVPAPHHGQGRHTGEFADGPHDAPAAPDTLGRYVLRQQLGAGGMGVVHLATDPAGRAVALKELPAHIAGDASARARLRREFTSLQRVEHPRVAPVLDADLDGARPYIVTRYIPGHSLEQRVIDAGPLQRHELAGLAVGLAGALDAIHAAGVVHRDLKPTNVLMLGDDPVVIDFGISQATDDLRLTQVGLVMGTPGFLAPEVLDGAAATPGVDWWAWAATLTYAATGRPPFGRGPLEAVLARVHRGEPDLAGVDASLAALLTAALAPDPGARPTPARLVAGMRDWEAGRTTSFAPPTERVPQGEHAPPVTAPVTPTAPLDSAAPLGSAVPLTPTASSGSAVPQPAASLGSAAPHGAPLTPTASLGPSATLGSASSPGGAAPVGSVASAPPPGSGASSAPPVSASPPPAPPESPVTQVQPRLSTRVMPAVLRDRGRRADEVAAAARVEPPVRYATFGSAPPRAAQPPAPPHPRRAAEPSYSAPHSQPPHSQSPYSGPSSSGHPYSGSPYSGSPYSEPVAPAVAQPAALQPRVHPEPRVRRGVAFPLFGLLVFVVALGASWPVAALAVAVVWSSLARTVYASIRGVQERRLDRGPRRSDGFVAVLLSPVRLVPATLVSVAVALGCLVVAVAGMFGTAALVSATGGLRADPFSEISLAVGGTVGVLVAWWGVGGTGLRRGSRALIRAVAPGRVGPALLGLLLSAAAAWLAIRLQGTGVGPDWAPLGDVISSTLVSWF